MSLIKIKNLFFTYKKDGVNVPIFKDFNLEIETGDFIAVKGPSGSGKSTLLYLIAGLLKLDAGSILFNGDDISKMSDQKLAFLRNKHIAFVFQQFYLITKASVRENIILPTMYPIEAPSKDKKKSIQRCEEISKRLGIYERLGHKPNQLSGGQQQRVAIGRALINGAEVILADEPTGNLDSTSTKNIIEILQELNREGKTIVLITHDDEVATAASKVYHLRDGHLKEEVQSQSTKNENKPGHNLEPLDQRIDPIFPYLKMLPFALSHAIQNKSRSLLTMLGITVGISAICSMITLGNFTKDKIIESYTHLGSNTILLRGYENWDLKATDEYPLKFKSFDWENEILKLKKIFPQIKLISPLMKSWNTTVSFAGKSIEKEPKLVGVSSDALVTQGRQLVSGKNISRFHIERKDSVCIIGADIAKTLFVTISPVGQVIHLSRSESTFACKVIGVLAEKSSSDQWTSPNSQIFIPFTFFQAISESSWEAQIREIAIQFHSKIDTERASEGIRTFFEKKYGSSGNFSIDTNSLLIAQMQKFLTLFSILLTAIAIVTLCVGGVGITNMMLVSVSERLKEIGIRKSIGATHKSIRYQFLLESILLCSFAGLVGVFFGIVIYQAAIYAASFLMEKLEFEWIIDRFALTLSFLSIFIIGVLSGLVPALKAEKLQIVEALRSE